MKLSVVIINWNAPIDTIRCVRKVISWRRLQPTVWVVDNDSTDASGQIIARELPHVQLICNASNLGFAGGSNQGIIHSLAVSDDPILLLNNDAFIEEEDVIQLLETLNQDIRAGVVGPLLFDAENESQLLSAGGKNPVLHHHPRWRQVPADKRVFSVEYVLGTVVLVRAKVFREVGLLDEDYFFIAEVADFCRRARAHRYKIVINAQARAFHNLSRSSGFRDTLYVYYTVRNRFLYIRKFYAHFKLPLSVFWVFYSLALATKLQVSGKISSARAVRLGLIDGLQGRFGNQNDRVLAKLPS